DPTGVDVNATVSRQIRARDLLATEVEKAAEEFSDEQEVAFTGFIAPRAVVSVYDRVTRQTGVFNQDTGTIAWSPGELDDGTHDTGAGERPGHEPLPDVP
ncbi:hypothetical protein NGM37_19200, partial [Streptomyces sp. TRM76130]|nr:hypothetical protein [Streptomyces sp. TRM76130]